MIQGYKELFDDYDSIEQDKEKIPRLRPQHEQ